jgi:uncharacterized protein (TIGR03663 family)
MSEKNPRRRKFASPVPDPAAPPPPVWVWSLLAISLVLRLWMLGDKPAHFDEGVNGWFLDRMFEKFAYNYDPENYHGPLHFYLAIPFVAALGSTEVALRLLPVLFSVGTVWLLLRFHPLIGTMPSIIAAAIFAVSPGAMFYGRYGIHEAELAFFVTLFGLSAMMLWSTGSGKWLLLLVASVAGAVATKETFFMNMLPLPMAAACVWALSRLTAQSGWALPPRVSGSWSWLFMGSIVVSALVFLEILYSGFGDYEGWGLSKFAQSYGEWSKTAEAGAGHIKPYFDLWGTPLNYYWVYLLWLYEWPVLIGVVMVVPFWRSVGGWARVVAVWGFGALLAYSLVPYKTPWCILSMLPPLCLAAGSGLWSATAALSAPPWGRLAVALALASTVLPRSILLNYRDYDLASEPYVYVQTHRGSSVLLDELRAAERIDPRVVDLPASISLGSYYPLPWWLDRYTQLEYSKEEAVPEASGKAWVLVPWSKRDEFLRKNSSGDWRIAKFRLRDAQEDVAACLNAKVFPAPGEFIFPESSPVSR